MAKAFLSLVLFFVFLNPLSVVDAYNNPVKDVLGTDIRLLEISPTQEGPGFFRPSNPFYFLDKLRHRIEVFLAYTPDRKVIVFEKTAGERSAEMRLELLDGNKKAADIAILDMVQGYTLATRGVGEIKGADREKFAIELNNVLKQKNRMLHEIEKQLPMDEKYMIMSARSKMLANKIKIEAYLPHDLLKKEITYDLAEMMKEETDETYRTAMKMKDVLGAYYELRNFVSETSDLSNDLNSGTEARVKGVTDSKKGDEKVMLQVSQMLKIIEDLRNEVNLAD